MYVKCILYLEVCQGEKKYPIREELAAERTTLIGLMGRDFRTLALISGLFSRVSGKDHWTRRTILVTRMLLGRVVSVLSSMCIFMSPPMPPPDIGPISMPEELPGIFSFV